MSVSYSIQFSSSVRPLSRQPPSLFPVQLEQAQGTREQLVLAGRPHGSSFCRWPCALGSSNTCSCSSLVASPSPVRLDSSITYKTKSLHSSLVRISLKPLWNTWFLFFCGTATGRSTCVWDHHAAAWGRDCHCPASTSAGITAQIKSVVQVHTGHQWQSRTQNSGSVTLSIVF